MMRKSFILTLSEKRLGRLQKLFQKSPRSPLLILKLSLLFLPFFSVMVKTSVLLIRYYIYGFIINTDDFQAQPDRSGGKKNDRKNG